MTNEYVLDDFRDGNGISEIGTSWQAFSDRVMGGRSDMDAGLVSMDGNPALMMRGRVSLENNGGFIQVRLPLQSGNEYVDGSGYNGIYVRLRGRPGSYSVHLRTRGNRLPWSYYTADLPVSGEWTTVYLPWEAFLPENARLTLPDTRELTSVAVVAGKKAFDAEVAVSEIGFYHSF